MNFKLSFSIDSLKCALIENVSIFVDEFDMLKHEQLKSGTNFPDILISHRKYFFYDFFPSFQNVKTDKLLFCPCFCFTGLTFAK